MVRSQQGADEVARMIVDPLGKMLLYSRKQPLKVTIALRSSVIGQSARLRALPHADARRDDAWFPKPGRVAEH